MCDIEYAVVQRSEKARSETSRQQTVNAALPLRSTTSIRTTTSTQSTSLTPLSLTIQCNCPHSSQNSGGEARIAYNPLFIYGKTGHGKTHLIQAVGNYLKNHGKKVFYVTRNALPLITQLFKAELHSFKDKYRQYDALIMDDVQFLANKEKTQEELFHLFNALHDNNKQIIFSSDIHPALSGLEDRPVTVCSRYDR